jgi:hypothetical protein
MSDEEQDWIAKYRAALGATPIKQSRVGTLVAGLKGIVQNLISAIGKASHGETSAQLDAKPVEEVSCLSVTQAAAFAPSRSYGSSAQSPGKRHLSDRWRRVS